MFCEFESSVDGVAPEAIPLDSRRILCVIPQLSSIGRSSFRLLLIDEEDKIIESQRRNFFAGKYFRK